MKRPRGKSSQKGAIELIEEAVHLLRQAPPSALATYYIGALPFVIGLLYFWAEMSRSPFAYQHLAGESLGLAALFLWMKIWQVRFARGLWAQISGAQLASFTLRQWANILTGQSALQVSGLFLMPIALILTAPFGWVYAFYQNATALADPDKPGLRHVFNKARKHSLLWPRQNHVLLSILAGFAIFVLLNWITVCLALPALAKTFFGIETVFTRSIAAMLNTTFFATMFALTYLSIDPLVKAVYTVRCFYGEALHSGEDIKAELKQVATAAGSFAVALLVAMVAVSSSRSSAHGAELQASCPEGTTENSPTLQNLWRGCNEGEKVGRAVPCAPIERSKTEKFECVCKSGGAQGTARPTFIAFGLQRRKPVLINAISPQGTTESASDDSVVPSGLAIFQTRFLARSLDENALLLTAADSSVPTRSAAAANVAPITSTPPPTSSVPPSELDQKIRQVLKENKYSWRFPRDSVKQPEAEKGPIGRFFESIRDMLRHWWISVRDWLGKILRKLFQGGESTRSSSGSGWIVSLHILLYVLIAAVIVCVAILLYRLLSKRGAKQAPIVSEPIPSAPDLLDENVGAEQLPEDSWTALGRELLQRGELRLALRAFYLGSLAHLASRNLINLARFKSNRDYYRELERRGHSFPQVLVLFADNVSVFDRIWYGMHEITPDLVNQFLSKVELIKTGGTAST